MDMLLNNSGLNNFTWNNQNSLDFGIVLASSMSHTTPERDNESIDIPGRNGSLLLSNNRYSNTQIPYECVLIPDTVKSYDEQLEAVLDWLYGGDNDSYQTLIDSYHKDTYRLARIVGAIEPERDGAVYRFTINFDCQPQRYYFNGNNWLDLSNTTINLINPSNYTAQPKIVISGNSTRNTLSDTITVDGVIYSFESWSGVNSNNGSNYINDVIIDSELQDVHLSDGTPINRYFRKKVDGVLLYPERVIELSAGKHTITHTGSCTVKIKPRWWKL